MRLGAYNLFSSDTTVTLDCYFSIATIRAYPRFWTEPASLGFELIFFDFIEESLNDPVNPGCNESSPNPDPNSNCASYISDPITPESVKVSEAYEIKCL